MPPKFVLRAMLAQGSRNTKRARKLAVPVLGRTLVPGSVYWGALLAVIVMDSFHELQRLVKIEVYIYIYIYIYIYMCVYT